ncbi:VPLPA-CTERM sorting domain-containing protein [Jannaschia seohaensis]|uniref:Putative secreted protein n=1 Tax=Jannaschia seohaensis TaxID=475081 RepID=A0A2Y9AQX9_9RHOB|nr:VPLPA-CTERM sorting domain-containing protein [Jannaschia seohaensis]PWJ18279.1 putative secreted protein [Jannaschia seohaensis]SSA46804.1 VPLPA-CTERM protein sorting domain-containing protein [Jannaschia seohaensis]
MATAMLLGSAAMAQAVSITLTDNLTTKGDTLEYAFSALPLSDGGPGTLTIATNGDGPVPGIDLDGTLEYFDVFFDSSTSLGRYECSTANDGGTLIPGASGGIDCQFSFDITISAGGLATALADGSALVRLVMGPQVNDFGEGDGIDVTLSYDEIAAVPLPASAWLLLAGLGAIALRRRQG